MRHTRFVPAAGTGPAGMCRPPPSRPQLTCDGIEPRLLRGVFGSPRNHFAPNFRRSSVSNSAHILSPPLDRRLYQPSLHPLRALLLGAADAFLVSGLLSDLAYFSDHQIQWKNFADWLIIGGLVFAGL